MHHRSSRSHRSRHDRSSCHEESKHRRRTKKPVQSFKKYLRKLRTRVLPCQTMSKRALSVVNSIMNTIFKLIADESGNLVHYKKQKTICTDEIKAAVKLLFPGALGVHATNAGDRAIKRFIYSK